MYPNTVAMTSLSPESRTRASRAGHPLMHVGQQQRPERRGDREQQQMSGDGDLLPRRSLVPGEGTPCASQGE